MSTGTGGRGVSGALAAAALVGALGGAQALAQVAAKKSDAGFLSGRWYATAELRHHLNTYYDTDGYYARQEPSAHARVQIGSQFYEGLIDAYLTLGVFKIPATQQLMQRRPELALDFYPVRGERLTLLQYNLVQLPVKADATVPMNEDDRAEGQIDPGVITTVGLAPTARYPFVALGSRFEVKGGLDGWTRLYSRRQYTGAVPAEDGEEDDGHGELALSGEEGEPIEDYAMHYRSQVLGGIGFYPNATKELSIEASAHYQSRFDPRYERDDDGVIDYEYGATRYSYYRLRLRYELTERVALTNDFYHFFDGAFQGRREGDDRRFRNIARLSCKL